MSRFEMPSPAKTHPFLKILLSLLFSFGLLLTLELLFRSLGYPNRKYPLYPLDRTFGWRMYSGSYLSTPVGLTAEYILLGDSIVYMNSFERGSFTQRLVKDFGYRVINLSGNGYGSDQELLYLKQFAPELPRIKKVILHFSLFNDFLDNISRVNPVRGYPPKPYFELVQEHLLLHTEGIDYSVLDYTAHYLKDRSGLYNGLRALLAKTPLLSNKERPILPLRWAPTDPPPNELLWKKYMELVRHSMPVTGAILKEMDHYVRDTLHAELIVLVHPMSFLPQGQEPLDLLPEFKTFFSLLSIDVEDLGCYFKKRSLAYPEVTMDKVGHLQERGHIEVTYYLAQRFTGKIPEPSCILSTPGRR